MVFQMNVRAISTKAVCRVIQSGLTLDASLAEYLPSVKNQKDKSLVKEICFGVIRWFDQLQCVLEHYLSKPIKAKDLDVQILILVGLYQLHYLKTPGHAAISETVGAAAALEKQWAKPLVNAVLRRSQREFNQARAGLDGYWVAEFSHPEWLVNKIRSDWPDHWRSILQANNERPPLHLRVNGLKTSRETYQTLLEKTGVQSRTIDLMPDAIEASAPVDVNQLPGFNNGHVSVQDAGAQMAVSLLNPQADERILDACAAPGGKTAHICEKQPSIKEIVAVDISQKRTALLENTLSRLSLKATVITADARATDAWWDGRLFDRILLDVPCSATGVIRRRPDVKHLRHAEQIPALNHVQIGLLKSCWPLLKQGGELVYSTCSVLKDENDLVIKDFLDAQPSAGLDVIQASWGVATDYGRQLLPGLENTDGFYYAILSRTA